MWQIADVAFFLILGGRHFFRREILVTKTDQYYNKHTVSTAKTGRNSSQHTEKLTKTTTRAQMLENALERVDTLERFQPLQHAFDPYSLNHVELQPHNHGFLTLPKG